MGLCDLLQGVGPFDAWRVTALRAESGGFGEEHAERARISERISDLTAARDRLDTVIANTRNPPPECVHHPEQVTPDRRSGPGGSR